MPGETTLGYLTYRLGLDKTKFDQGIKVTKDEIRGLGREGDVADVKLRKLGSEVSILGGSLATMGGLAMGAGLALGNEGLGGALTSAGMGMSILGGTLATIVPAMRGLAVVIEGQLIPALIAANAFLGPAGWLVIGIGLAAAALYVFTRNTKDHAQAMEDAARAAELQKTNVEGLTKALTEKQRLEKEMAGVPASREDLQFQLTGAKLDERTAYERVQKAVAEGTTGTDLEQIGYSYLAAQRRTARIQADLAALDTVSPALAGATRDVSRWSAAGELGTTFDQTGQFQISAGTGGVQRLSQGSIAPSVSVYINELTVTAGQSLYSTLGPLLGGNVGDALRQKGQI